MRRFFRRTKNALNYIRRAEWAEFAARLKYFVKGGDHWKAPEGPIEKLNWGIITPPHSAYIASLLAKRLREWGARVEVMHETPKKFSHDYYIALSPQVFRRLPPGERLYVYQLEQTLASNWFSKRYLNILENCRGVLEYKQGNFSFLARHKITFPHVHFLPIGGNPDLLAQASAQAQLQTSRPVLFYGAWKGNPRRKELLHQLEKQVCLLRQDNLFATALYEFVWSQQAMPVIVNLHHYDPAQLETPRLWEAASLGAPIVSEDTPDKLEDPLLNQAIELIPSGDVAALTSTLKSAANQPVDLQARRELIEAGWVRFCTYLDRFLLAEGFLTPDDKRRTAQSNQNSSAPPQTYAPQRWCLTLPETDQRYQAALRLPVSRHYIGVRKRPGWKGCALSYRDMARQALAEGIDALWIFEDDITLPDSFENKISEIWRHLSDRDDWDICVGHLTLVDEKLHVERVERLSEINLLYVNQFLGAAANLYHRRALEVMAQWNPDAGDEYDNTIDQFMNSRGLRTVAAWPYLVTHDDDQQSTLWGFNNAHYQQTIQATRQRLNDLCATDY